MGLLADFLIQHGYDRESLARYTTADLSLLMEGMLEVLDVLGADGIRVTPSSTAIIRWIPRWLLVAGFRAALPTHFIESGALYHLSQAPDEMAELARELRELVEKSGLPVPAVRKVLRMNPL